MKRLLSLFRQDLTLVTRDSILVYIFLAPILLSVAARVFVPSLTDAAPTVVVTADAPAELGDQLEGLFEVEVVEDLAALERRVAANDDVAGVVAVQNGTTGGERAAGASAARRDASSAAHGSSETGYRLILQGNEEHEVAAAFAAGVTSLLDVDLPVAFETSRIEGEEPKTAEYVAVIVILMTTVLGGMLAGFTMVDDRSTGAVRALGVSPLRLWQYLLEKAFFILVYSLVAGLLSALIMLGTSVDFGLLALTLVVAFTVPMVLSITMGVYAGDQIAAIGMAKITMPIYLTPPVVAIFIGRDWHGFFYPLPNYWLFNALTDVVIGEYTAAGALPSSLLALAGGLAVALIFAKPLRKRFMLR